MLTDGSCSGADSRTGQTRQFNIRRFTRFSWCLLLVMLIGGPSIHAAQRHQKPQPVLKPDDLAQRIHVLINSERSRHGLKPLAWDNQLARVAGMHSRDMSRRKYLGHDSPEGNTFSDRYRQAGYACDIRVGMQIYAGAENIALARLYNSETTINSVTTFDWNSPAQLAHRTVDGWMNSRGHRENILTPHWRQEGIGIEIGPGNAVYITQNFC